LSQPKDPAPGGKTPATAMLPGQPRDAEGPVFAEPWQAQAFALTVKLHEAGCFTWKEWAETLGARLAKAEQLAEAERQGEPDDGSRYYEHWLAALELLVTAKGLLDAGSLKLRRNDWEHAYRTTPHGQAVLLKE